jgi:hypothetical protein
LTPKLLQIIEIVELGLLKSSCFTGVTEIADNSGGMVAGESAEDARTAHIALYHDAGHASYLELPIAGTR